MITTRKTRVLFLAAEAAPLAAAGGLADVVGSLPKALNREGVDVRVLLPHYTSIDAKKFSLRDTEVRVSVPFDGIGHVVRLLSTTLPGSRVPVLLIDHPHYEGNGHIYYQDVTNGKDQQELQVERFLFLTAAARAIIRKSAWRPDIVHFHDWHTSTAPLFFSCPTVATIHNLALQGTVSMKRFRELLGNTVAAAVPKSAVKGAHVNLTRLGLLSASAITTVSPTYAKEILTKTNGAGCDDVLRKRKRVVTGILNGIDTDVYDPRHDRIILPYSHTNLQRKKRNTVIIRRMFKLKNNGPVLGVVSRLTEQKGIELICSSAKQLVQWGMNLVILGTGTPEHETLARECGRRFPGSVSTTIGFDPRLARQIYAGSDAFLMPSKFEPCGLGQMIALRYGTVPVVRSVGGLADTIHEGKDGNGFTFKPYSVTALLNACKRMGTLYKDTGAFRALQERCMNTRVSWDASAKQYHNLYQQLLSRT